MAFCIRIARHGWGKAYSLSFIYLEIRRGYRIAESWLFWRVSERMVFYVGSNVWMFLKSMKNWESWCCRIRELPLFQILSIAGYYVLLTEDREIMHHTSWWYYVQRLRDSPKTFRNWLDWLGSLFLLQSQCIYARGYKKLTCCRIFVYTMWIRCLLIALIKSLMANI